MGDAVPSAPEERAPAEASNAVAEEVQELHVKNEEEQGATAEQLGTSGDGFEEQKNDGDATGEEEEEPAECGFCLFMKSGPCRESFISWEQCIEQAEKDKEDMVEKCHKVTFVLKECMEHNSDYYEPVLQAEKAMGEAALEEEETAAAAQEGVAESNPPQSENSLSLDALHSQPPSHMDTEGHHTHKEEEHTHESSDSPAEAHHPPDSHATAQEHPSS